MPIDLESFKNIHPNSDIYVIGSGKSLDYIDNSFFENKITIGTNQTFKKFLPVYLVRKDFCLLNDSLKINTTHFISYGNYGLCNDKNKQHIMSCHNDSQNVVIFDHDKNNLNFITNELPNDGKLFVSWSIITTGMHLAAYMGAKNIILVGHDCGSIDNECNFTDYHTEDTYKLEHQNGKSGYIDWLKQIEEQTIILKKLLCNKYGCNVYSLNPFINFNLEGHIYST